ncbi:MAG: AMP-binding protein [Clostridia bacterium]|nr:AMP-binding protein [Clostridia bacterium]
MDLVGERTLGDLWDEKLELCPDRTFLVFEDRHGAVRQWTYREFHALIDAAARGFSTLGIEKGQKVTVHLPNSPEFLLSWFALARLGAVMVPSNTANTAPEMQYVLDFSDSVAVVSEPAYVPVLEEALRHCPKVRHRVLARSSEQRAGWLRFDDLLAAGGEPVRPTVASEDVVEIIFTSGTTSRPKGVMLTHANCLRSGERMAKHLGLRPDDRNMSALPAFHCNCQSVTILSSLTVGATVILLEQFSASRFMEQARRHKATATSIVPALLRTIAAQPPSPDDRRHSIRVAFYAINVTDREKAEFDARFGIDLVNGYGLTEAMTIVTIAPLYGPRRWPSIGLPAYDRQVKIVGPDGMELPPGQIGEIIVGGTPGRTLMKGYYKNPEATAEALRDGWLHTGDQGWMDERGYFYFFDRSKDVIKRGAENVSASEVESVLMDHPDILEAAVIAVPDPIKDEAVKAFVVLKPGARLTEREIQEYCAARLAKFKVPQFVEFRDALPKTSIGKVEKKLLRQQSGVR